MVKTKPSRSLSHARSPLSSTAFELPARSRTPAGKACCASWGSTWNCPHHEPASPRRSRPWRGRRTCPRAVRCRWRWRAPDWLVRTTATRRRGTPSGRAGHEPSSSWRPAPCKDPEKRWFLFKFLILLWFNFESWAFFSCYLFYPLRYSLHFPQTHESDRGEASCLTLMSVITRFVVK